MSVPATTAEAAAPGGYRALMAVPGFPRLALATLLARTGQQMTAIVLVLFILARFGSASLAGVAVFLAIFPGLLLSPLAGALLDRGRRLALICLDYGIAAASPALLAGLSLAHHLPAAVLLLVVAGSALTVPLSATGTRSLYPLMVPRPLWDRANAVDSACYGGAAVVGPALAGGIVGAVNPEAGLIAVAVMFGLAALSVAAVPEIPVTQRVRRSVSREALAGLVYVVRNPSLRGLALTLSVFNVGSGILIVALPVLVLDRLHRGPGSVGAVWAVLGAAGLVAVLASGRVASEGRERAFMAVGGGICALGVAGLIGAPTLAVVALFAAIFGIGNGPLDIGLFGLRQRRTDPAWLGRAFAVSMSLNYMGTPLGSALAGPLLAHSLSLALGVATGLVVISMLCLLTIPRSGAVRRA